MLYRYSICRKRAFSPTIACKIATTGTNTHNPGIKWYRSYFSRWFRWRDHTSQVLSCSFKPAAPYVKCRWFFGRVFSFPLVEEFV